MQNDAEIAKMKIVVMAQMQYTNEWIDNVNTFIAQMTHLTNELI